MAFYYEFNRIEKLTVYEAVCKVCEKYEISENDINEMDTYLTSYFYKDELTKSFNKYGFDKNRDLLQQFIVDFKELQRINKEYDENLTRIDNHVKIYLFLTEEHTTDEKLSFFTQFFYHEVLRIERKDENLINELNMIFTDQELHNIRVICELIKFRSTYARLLFKNIKQEDRLFVIDNYYKEVYGSAFHCLTEEEKEYLINKSKETNDIIINKRKNAYESPMEYVMALHK